ncbi:copper resistance protein CopC [Amycolatopsis sp. NPDC024027]|uniref:copper resistance CopC family protein n=1 Tax=Amycolatopsis sp. NPDC024027 TaxID=3154327 RepID=UPI0033C2CC26
MLLTAGPASAHTELESSSPAEGASLAAAPSKIELIFEEPVTLQPDPISVTGPDGAKWMVGTAAVSASSAAPASDIGSSVPAWVWILIAVLVVVAAAVVALRLVRQRP